MVDQNSHPSALRVTARALATGWRTYVLVGAGAAYGFVCFCYPELRLRATNPEGWKLLWAVSETPTWLRCAIMIVVGVVVGVLPYAVMRFVVIARKLRLERLPDALEPSSKEKPKLP